MLLITFSVFRGDTALLLSLLQWIETLGRCPAHDCLIVADAATPFDEIIASKVIAQRIFRSVEVITNAVSVDGWIEGPKSLFLCAAGYAQRANKPFLVLETDSIPLKPGWAEAIEAEYVACGKRFMGHVYASNNAALPPLLMSGIGVYAADTHKTIGPLMRPGVNWDISTASEAVPNAHNSKLIHHLWGEMNNPPVFADVNIPGTAQFCLKQIPEEAVIWHRDKTHSLIPLLAKKLSLPWKTASTNGKADVVSLRRAGDIINLLPILQTRAEKYKRPQKIVVHRDFAEVLDGVSYAEPVIWDGDWEDPLAAAKKHNATNAQVFGKGLSPDIYFGNFARLAWQQIGERFNRHEPLIFDRRSSEREKALRDSIFKTDKPKILVKLDGNSSPFGERNWVRQTVRNEFSERAEIISLDDVKAHRLYDLIGLMDHAHCLITSDTSTLWLAHATQCPSIQFVNGRGFSASPPRGNCIKRVPYQEVQVRWGEISTVISKTVTTTKHGNSKVLVFSDFRPHDSETVRRQNAAFKTWGSLGARMHPFHPKRNSTQFGDNRAMPFVRDMIRSGFESGSEDIVVITNNDILFSDSLAKSIDNACEAHGCWWSYRVNGLTGNNTDQGADTFAFTRSWWHLHEHLFPDFLLGYWWWDDVMVRLMRWSGCDEQERLIFHEPHPHTQSPNRTNTPGHHYNENLANLWLKTHEELREKP